jgi:predicted lipoprotein with Yx(FWY)xxD motif
MPPASDQPNIPNVGGTAFVPVFETATPMTAAPSEIPATTETRAVTETPETLMVSNEGTSPFLVDDQGRSLYVYLNDSQHSSTSACVDDCAVDWPPLTVKVPPVGGPGVDASLLGIIVRDDGSTQVTYNGWPLYYYVMDTIPGTTNAPTLDDLWFLISPSGEPIRR